MPGASRTPLRKDIQGLRAVAVLAVLLWHAKAPFAPGGFVGVDVFFVISGFLMTQLLVTELEQHGRVSVPRFYARRVRRLLPAAATALLGVLALTWWWLPQDRWRGVGLDVAASALYVVNWRMADTAVDYLAEGSAPSPVQHFWSLSVEEQFYALWPLLIAVVGWLLVRRRTRELLRVWLLLVLGAVTLASFAWSVHLTQSQPERAYFVTTTRLWELGLGGLVAIVAPALARRGLPARVADVAVAWGLGAVAASIVLLDTSTAFPGWVAAVPTVGTAAVIAAGPFATGPAVRLLEPPAMQWVGGLSYSLYLWHWPLLVAAAARSDAGALSVPAGLGVVALSFVPAWLSLRLVEDPLRRPRSRLRPLPALRLGAACTALSLTAGLVLLGWTEREAHRQQQLVASAVGAGTLVGRPLSSYRPADDSADLVPSPALANDDVFHDWYDRCSPAPSSDALIRCVYGDPRGRVRVVLVGDSHAVMWLPALTVVAKERHWRLEVLTKSACPFVDVVVVRKGEPNTPCASHDHKVLADIEAHPPDLVVAAQLNTYELVAGGQGPEAFGAALARTWRTVERTGAHVVTVMDVPQWHQSPAECVAKHRHDLRRCALPAAEVLVAHNRSQRHAIELVPAVDVIDLSRWVCPGRTCPVVIGDVLVYRDAHHLSATYVRTLTQQVRAAVASLPTHR